MSNWLNQCQVFCNGGTSIFACGLVALGFEGSPVASAVPSGLGTGGRFPALKRRAIVGNPFGTGTGFIRWGEAADEPRLCEIVRRFGSRGSSFAKAAEDGQLAPPAKDL